MANRLWWRVQAKRKYGDTRLKLLQANLRRELTLISRGRFLYIFRTCQVRRAYQICEFLLPVYLRRERKHIMRGLFLHLPSTRELSNTWGRAVEAGMLLSNTLRPTFGGLRLLRAGRFFAMP